VSKGKDTREKEQLKKKGKKEELMQEKLKKTGAKKVSPDLTPHFTFVSPLRNTPRSEL